jgi:hypothetical protein
MAGLSVLLDGVFISCANPIFPIFESADSFVFEVFEQDASLLKNRLGKMDEYRLGTGQPFSGKLDRLEKCESTHPGLAHLRNKPTLRAVMTVHKVLSDVKQ